jgi:hypothetical protein
MKRIEWALRELPPILSGVLMLALIPVGLCLFLLLPGRLAEKWGMPWAREL